MNNVSLDSNGVAKSNMMSQQMRFSMAMNQRKIIIYDDVDESSVIEAIYYLNRLKYIDSKFSQTKEPIELQINTNGGAIEDGFSLISMIENMKDNGYQIITTNIGKGYSMGFLLSICGSIRQAYKYSKYMYHDASYGAYGKHGDVMEMVDFVKMLRNDILYIVTKYTNKPCSYFENLNNSKKDTFFTVSDMIQMGGLDSIV